MPRYMTRRERQKKVTAHYYKPREKLVVALAVIAVAAVLVAGIATSLQTRQDPILTVLLAVGLLAWILISVFVLDMFTFQAA